MRRAVKARAGGMKEGIQPVDAESSPVMRTFVLMIMLCAIAAALPGEPGGGGAPSDGPGGSLASDGGGNHAPSDIGGGGAPSDGGGGGNHMLLADAGNGSDGGGHGFALSDGGGNG